MLEGILKQARTNGVESGEIIDREELRKREPHVEAIRALFFSTSGIVDSHGLMKQLETEAINNGTRMAYGNEVVAIRKVEGGYEVDLTDDSGSFTFTTKKVINAAGLGAWDVSRMAGLDNPRYKQHFWKGQYWAVGFLLHQVITKEATYVERKNCKRAPGAGK
jgi:L-2-hydroxyglutarate oxidase LhgO